VKAQKISDFPYKQPLFRAFPVWTDFDGFRYFRPIVKEVAAKFHMAAEPAVEFSEFSRILEEDHRVFRWKALT